MGFLRFRLLLSVEWTNSNRYILIRAKTFEFHRSTARRRLQEKTTRSLPQIRIGESSHLSNHRWRRLVWETAVLSSQIPQAAVCPLRSCRTTLEFLSKKSRSPGKEPRGNGYWRLHLSLPQYTSRFTFLLHPLSGSKHCENLRDTGLKNSSCASFFKRHWSTGSLLEPKRRGERCKCAFLSIAINGYI